MQFGKTYRVTLKSSGPSFIRKECYPLMRWVAFSMVNWQLDVAKCSPKTTRLGHQFFPILDATVLVESKLMPQKGQITFFYRYKQIFLTSVFLS